MELEVAAMMSPKQEALPPPGTTRRAGSPREGGGGGGGRGCGRDKSSFTESCGRGCFTGIRSDLQAAGPLTSDPSQSRPPDNSTVTIREHGSTGAELRPLALFNWTWTEQNFRLLKLLLLLFEQRRSFKAYINIGLF